MKIRICNLVAGLALLCTAYQSSAQVSVARIFTDNMVLQRGQPIPVWGKAKAGEKITLSFDKKSTTTTADKDGKWMAKLPSHAAGGPFELIIKASNKLVFSNVLVGDVWICSGQSNMAWPVSASNNAEEEIAAANYPNIRHISIPEAISGSLQSDLDQPADWQVCSNQTAEKFSAVAYYFGRRMNQKLNVPIGLITTAWGGTQVEAWISRDPLEKDSEFAPYVGKLGQIDQMLNDKKQSYAARMQSMFGDVSKIKEDSINWKKSNFDDSSWRTLKVPQIWEEQGLEGLDGIIWFRKQFNLPTAATQDAVLHLGTIDDNDIVYLNGVKIGQTQGYNIIRNYTIDKSLLKAGTNTIALRVEDTGGGGGFSDSKATVSLSIGSQKIVLNGEWKYALGSIPIFSFSMNPNSNASLLYNAMIAPLIKYSIKGAIWYQGESNTGRSYQYRKSFPMMINDWRTNWKQGNFPFLFVQLANYQATPLGVKEGGWAELREAQSMALSLPNTGMAVTIDIGEAKDIHPKNKQDVGKRLADNALYQFYGFSENGLSPMYKSMKITKDQIILTFKHTGKGLIIKDNKLNANGFMVADADQNFVPVTNAICKNNQIIIPIKSGSKPVAVRYAWADSPANLNVYNQEGLPLDPFRTDSWKGATEGKKFNSKLF